MTSKADPVITSRPRNPLRRLRARLLRERPKLGRALRPLRRAVAELRDAPGPARQIHVVWSEAPSRSLTFCWVGTSRRNPARLQVRPGPGEPWIDQQGTTSPLPASRGYLHYVIVRDLTPDRPYSYRVSCDIGYETAWSDVHTTRTAPEASPTRFEAVFLCDVGLAGRSDGTTTTTSNVIEAIRSTNPLVVLGGGDYVYANSDQRFLDPGDAISAWFEQMEPLIARAPMMAQLGNHEIELAERSEDWAPRFPRPAGGPSGWSYSFDVGPAHFVGLHAPGRAPSSGDLRWLEADLASPAARAARWRIVFQHAPVVAHGTSHPARPEVRALMPLFDRLGFDLHLSGHDQSYERTHALRMDGTPTKPTRLDGRSVYLQGSGVVYAKVSPAGKLSDRGLGFSRLPEDRTPEVAARDDHGHHWARLRVDCDELCVTVESLRTAGGPVTSIDEFSLVALRT